ncbi:MAG: alpha/beta hydrolase [Patescibacteria group bacterium]|nr:alpha/beta hydrolase [Patescibacteria group bacterium]
MKIVKISCRENFKGETAFSDGLLAAFSNEKFLPISEFIDRNRGFFTNTVKRVAILVHGYSGIYESIEKRYQKIEKSFNPTTFDLFLEFYWPGSWEPSIGFVAAKNRSGKSGEYFEKLLEILNFDCKYLSNGVRLYIIAHSLGCHVATEAKYNLGRHNTTYFLAAPAINIDQFNKKRALLYTRKGIVFFSERDKVLKYFFRIDPDNWFSPSVVYARERVKPDFLKVVDFCDLTDVIGSDHSGYVDAPIYFKMIEERVKELNNNE